MLKNNFLIAIQSIISHKLRSALTLSSIVIGVMCIIVMSSLATSGLNTLTKTIDSLGGSRIIFLFQYYPEKRNQSFYFKKLTTQDYRLLKKDLPFVDQVMTYSTKRRQDISIVGSKKLWNIDVVDTENDFVNYLGYEIAEGRLFQPYEIEKNLPVCILGHKAKQKIFGSKDAVGKEITYKGKRLQVIGVLKNRLIFGMGFGFSWNELILRPIYNQTNQVESVLIKTKNSKYNKTVREVANAILLSRHNGVDDFRFFDFSSFLDKFKMVFLIIQIVVGLIAGVSLLIGGIGVMNIMLVAISERTREIGIRKAIGANTKTILSQFLVESTILSLIGGLIGVLFSLGACQLAFIIIEHFVETWVSVVSQPAIIVALISTTFIGVVFGYYPAKKAANLDPIDALRS